MQALVLHNPAAGGGRSEDLWPRVRSSVCPGFDTQVIRTDVHGLWTRQVHAALDRGTRLLVAAGGDGTVNALANAILLWPGGLEQPSAVQDVTLGAVGLGSSNDFHKPTPGGAEVSIKSDPSLARPRDLCRASYLTVGGDWKTRHFLVSAALGVTARANALFNQGDGLLRLLKARWTSGAILYAAVRTILSSRRGVEANIWIHGRGEVLFHQTRISNLSLLKTPHLSGGLRFDTPAAVDDGLLCVNLCHDMGRLRLLRTLAALSRGRFFGRPGCLHWSARRVTVEPAVPVALELDGEVDMCRRVTFEVLPGQLRVCA